MSEILSDTLHPSAGGRYTDDKRQAVVLRRSFTGGYSPLFGGIAVPFATTSNFNGSDKFTDFSPRVSLAWDAAEDHNVYSLTRRADGINDSFPGATTNANARVAYTAAQGLVGVKMRASASAFTLFVLTLLGIGGGPTLVGSPSSHFMTDGAAVSLRRAGDHAALQSGQRGAPFHVVDQLPPRRCSR